MLSDGLGIPTQVDAFVARHVGPLDPALVTAFFRSEFLEPIIWHPRPKDQRPGPAIRAPKRGKGRVFVLVGCDVQKLDVARLAAIACTCGRAVPLPPLNPGPLIRSSMVRTEPTSACRIDRVPSTSTMTLWSVSIR